MMPDARLQRTREVYGPNSDGNWKAWHDEWARRLMFAVDAAFSDQREGREPVSSDVPTSWPIVGLKPR